MRNDLQAKLEKLGLSAVEAQVYFALVCSGGTLGASAVATATGVPRTNVYPVLKSLVDKGIVEAEEGYGSRFTAVRPKEALPSLIVRAREDLFQSETLARELVEHLESLAEPQENNGESEVIQVLRDPRVINERFERLQREARHQVDGFVKHPIFEASNLAELEALRRGVRYRFLYEQAVIDAPNYKSLLSQWIAAGEEARVYPGELPHKLIIFDGESILLPLVTPGRPTRTLFIQHPQLATSLGMFFETLWERAEPIVPGNRRTAKIASGHIQPKSKSRKAACAVVAPSGNHRRNDKSPSTIDI